MNMINQLRQRIKQTGKTEITVDEYNQLQSEWIIRAPISNIADKDKHISMLIDAINDAISIYRIPITAKLFEAINYETK
jgi:hypothetical protein